MAADRQTDIHTTSANAVTLVWGSLRLAPINIYCTYDTGCSSYNIWQSGRDPRFKSHAVTVSFSFSSIAPHTIKHVFLYS